MPSIYTYANPLYGMFMESDMILEQRSAIELKSNLSF